MVHIIWDIQTPKYKGHVPLVSHIAHERNMDHNALFSESKNVCTFPHLIQ